MSESSAEDFQRDCPRCLQPVKIPADQQIQRARCPGCSTLYGITNRLGGLDLLAVNTREGASIRAKHRQIDELKKWLTLLVIAGLLVSGGMFLMAYGGVVLVLGLTPVSIVVGMVLVHGQDALGPIPARHRPGRPRRQTTADVTIPGHAQPSRQDSNRASRYHHPRGRRHRQRRQ